MLGEKITCQFFSSFIIVLVLRRLIELESYGFSPKVKKSYKYDKCKLGMKQASSKTPLGINNLSSAFLLLLFGYGLAIIAFLVEVIINTQKMK